MFPDPHYGYTFREMLVNNGIPYDGRDYVTMHRNNLILDGFFDRPLYHQQCHLQKRQPQIRHPQKHRQCEQCQKKYEKS